MRYRQTFSYSLSYLLLKMSEETSLQGAKSVCEKTFTTVKICRHDYPCDCVTSRRYSESEIDTVYLSSYCVPCKDKSHKEWFTCGYSHAGHVLRLVKHDDGSLSFCCEYNHFVGALANKPIVGLDKYHGGWVTDALLECRNKRALEAENLCHETTQEERPTRQKGAETVWDLYVTDKDPKLVLWTTKNQILADAYTQLRKSKK